jgi:uncharacterized protein
MRFDRVPTHSQFAGFHFEELLMAIPKDLLDILVCPVCKTPVKPLVDGSGLKCATCRRVYPVRDDILVMMSEEAEIAQE